MPTESTAQCEVTNIKPLVLVIDDRERARNAGIEYFRNVACDVISAGKSNEALRKYLNSPQIDLVFTDIDLLGDDDKPDKSGVNVARFIRELDSSLPIFGHSSKFEAKELTSEEQSLFSGYYEKGGTMEEVLGMFLEMKGSASEHRKNRFDQIMLQLERLAEKGQLSNETLDRIQRTPFLSQAVSIPQFKAALSETGYKLRLVDPVEGSNKCPILVWVRSSKDGVETELYGYPDLYSYGIDEKDALEHLFSLIKGYAADYRGTQDSKYGGAALQVKRFIETVWEE